MITRDSIETERSTRHDGRFTPRHGGIIQITRKEYKRLVRTFGMD